MQKTKFKAKHADCCTLYFIMTFRSIWKPNENFANFIINEKHGIGIINIICELTSDLQRKEGDGNMQTIMNWNSVLIISTNKNAQPFQTIEHKKLQNKIIAIQNITQTTETTRRCHKLQNWATRIES